jgi:hypothetical protein
MLGEHLSQSALVAAACLTGTMGLESKVNDAIASSSTGVRHVFYLKRYVNRHTSVALLG